MAEYFYYIITTIRGNILVFKSIYLMLKEYGLKYGWLTNKIDNICKHPLPTNQARFFIVDIFKHIIVPR